MKERAEIERAMRTLVAAAESALRDGDPVGAREITAAHFALTWVTGAAGASGFERLLDHLSKILAAESN